MTAYHAVTTALTRRGRKGKGSNWQCPAHYPDNDRSLSVYARKGGNGVHVRCHAGCSEASVLEALDLTITDLFDDRRESRTAVRSHVYRNAAGEPMFRIDRFSNAPPFGVKRFECGKWRPGLGSAEIIPYNLPQLLKAVQQGEWVYFCEGEKDADSVSSLGLTATSLPFGANRHMGFRQAEVFRGGRVIVVADADTQGRAFAWHRSRMLVGVADELRILEPATGKDMTEHLEAGLRIEELIPIDPTSDLGLMLDPNMFSVELFRGRPGVLRFAAYLGLQIMGWKLQESTFDLSIRDLALLMRVPNLGKLRQAIRDLEPDFITITKNEGITQANTYALHSGIHTPNSFPLGTSCGVRNAHDMWAGNHGALRTFLHALVQPEQGIAEISRRCGQDRRTTVRQLSMLDQWGLLTNDPFIGWYASEDAALSEIAKLLNVSGVGLGLRTQFAEERSDRNERLSKPKKVLSVVAA